MRGAVLAALALSAAGVSPPPEEAPNTTFGAVPANMKFGFDDAIIYTPEAPLARLYHDQVKFEITSEETKTLEVVLYVANGWEAFLDLTIRSDSDAPDTPDPHVVAGATCYHLFDECLAQQRVQYTLPPLISPRSLYANRLALRVEAPTSLFRGSSLKGEWTVKIANNLPDRAATAAKPPLVRLEVHQRTYTTLGWIVRFACIAAAVMLVALLSTDYLSGRIQANSGLLRNGGTAPEEVPPRTIRQSLGSLRDRAARRARDAMRYTRLAPDAPSAEEAGGVAPEGEAPPDRMCRICKKLERDTSEEVLLAPCGCGAPVPRFVHRSCAEEAADENGVLRCGECGAVYELPPPPGRCRQVKQTAKAVALSCAYLVAIWVPFLVVGFLFKLTVGVLFGGLDRIVWRADVYHHIVAVAVLFSYSLRVEQFTAPLEKLLPGSPWARHALLVLSLLLDIPAGWVGNFVVWCLTGILWDWQVHYCKGVVVATVFTNTVLHSISAGYQAWHARHRIDRVVEDPEGPHARRAAEDPPSASASASSGSPIAAPPPPLTIPPTPPAAAAAPGDEAV